MDGDVKDGMLVKREMLSSLWLQMALHYHLHLTPFTMFSQIACFVLKYDYIHSRYRVILLAIHLISTIAELIRPFLGYYGNLQEKIPALSGFWIVNVILQLPIYLFLLLNPEIISLPLERFVYSLNIIFIFVETVAVTRLIRRLANQQMERFRSILLFNKKTSTISTRRASAIKTE